VRHHCSQRAGTALGTGPVQVKLLPIRKKTSGLECPLVFVAKKLEVKSRAKLELPRRIERVCDLPER
jgi:hypothetical protein